MLATLLAKEFEQEMETSLKMLKIVPSDKFSWQPHPKSMNLGKLAHHIAEIHGWPKFCVETEDVDFGINPWNPAKADDAEGLLEIVTNLSAGTLQTLKNIVEDTF